MAPFALFVPERMCIMVFPFLNDRIIQNSENMERKKISSFAELSAYVGQELGVSEWLQVTQTMINGFADSTLDHQWIHVNEAKCAAESPYGSTIAHGYLTLSLLPYLWNQIVEVSNFKMQVNYGINNFRFGDAVKVGSRVRLKATLAECADLRGITKCTISVVMEIEGNRKPAYKGDVVFLYHFNN